MRTKIWISCAAVIVCVMVLVLRRRMETAGVNRQDAKSAKETGGTRSVASAPSNPGRSDIPVATGPKDAGKPALPDGGHRPPLQSAASEPAAPASHGLTAGALAAYSIGSQTIQPGMNDDGVFHEVRIEPRQRIAVQVAFPAGDPGQRVVAMVEDGGTLRDGERVLPMQLDAQRQVAFQFNTGENRGVYRVRLRCGTETKMVQFWAGEPLALAAR